MVELYKLEQVLFNFSSKPPLVGERLAEAETIADYCKKFKEYTAVDKLIVQIDSLLGQSRQGKEFFWRKLERHVQELLLDSKAMLVTLKKEQYSDGDTQGRRRTFDEHAQSFSRLVSRYEHFHEISTGIKVKKEKTDKPFSC